VASLNGASGIDRRREKNGRQAVTTDLGEQLRDADPLAREPELSGSDIQAMKEALLSRAQPSLPETHAWTTLVLAGALACVLMVVAVVTKRVEPVARTVQEPSQTQQLQVQFQTPSGTRIVWVLNPNLPL
jgi:negative regulator of sigma E activity